MPAAARNTVHDAAIRFRVHDALLASAEAKARRDGMNLSELMRHALRRELRDPQRDEERLRTW